MQITFLEYATNINLVPVLGLAILILFALFNTTFNKYQSRLFLTAAAVNILAIVAISTDYVIMATGDSLAHLYWLRRITSFLNFALSPAIGYFLLVIAANKRIKSFWSLPLIINTILCFISMFAPIVFNITTLNKYGRGVLFMLPIVISIFYIGLLLFTNISRNTQVKTLERSFLTVVIFLIATGMVLEMFFNMYFIMWGISATSLSFYYLLLNINRFIVDPLTQVFNRAAFEKRSKMLEEKKAYSYAIIDINDFKYINDTFGHDAGDKCLKYFGKLLTRTLNTYAQVYRIGGDEFACFFKTANMIKIEKGIEKMREEAGSKELFFAAGISHYEEGKTMEAIQRAADIAMYTEKSKMKHDSPKTTED